MQKVKLIIILLAIVNYSVIKSQTEVNWGYQAKNDNFCSAQIKAIDIINNSYVVFPYDNTITFHDTTFHHSGGYIYRPNFAVVKFSQNGEFIKALDFYTDPGGNLYSEYRLTVDNNQNMYIMIQYYKNLYINDSLYFNSVGENTDLILLKFDKDFNLIWHKFMYSDSQDWCHGLCISNDYLFISTEHYGNHFPTLLNIFNQDTVVFGNSILTMLKCDLDGDILWRKVATSDDPGLMAGEAIIGEDGNFYTFGIASVDTYIDHDTIFIPNPSQYPGYPIEIVLKPDGTIKRAVISNNRMIFIDKLVDKNGNFFISAYIGDTIIFGEDTLKYSYDSSAQLIAKTDSLYNPIWYQLLETNPEMGYGLGFHLDLVGDSLFFASTAKGPINFMDSTYVLKNKKGILHGLFSSEGELLKAGTINASSKIIAARIKVDNCYNPLLSGFFHGTLITESDTLKQTTNNFDDGFVIKLNYNNVPTLDIGTDTSIMLNQSIVLNVPNYYNPILWSNGETSHSITLHGETLGIGLHKVWVNAFYHNCIFTDTLNLFVIDNSYITDNINYEINVFPNPAKKILYIKTDYNDSNIATTIYNTLGKKILEKKIKNNEINISLLKDGIYILKVELYNKTLYKKIIIRK